MSCMARFYSAREKTGSIETVEGRPDKSTLVVTLVVALSRWRILHATIIAPCGCCA